MTARVGMDTSIRDNDIIMLCLFREKKSIYPKRNGDISEHGQRGLDLRCSQSSTLKSNDGHEEILETIVK